MRLLAALRNPTIPYERTAIRDIPKRSENGVPRKSEREVHVSVHVCRSCASEKECPPVRARALALAPVRRRVRACASKENVHVSSYVSLGARGEEAKDGEETTRGEKSSKRGRPTARAKRTSS